MQGTAGGNVASRLCRKALAEWGSGRCGRWSGTLEFDDSQYSNLEVQVWRHSGYYVKKIMLTVLLIVGMLVGVDRPDRGGRPIAISMTLAQAIAFNFVVNDALPKILYFTSMDYYLTLSFFAIVFNVLENVVSFYISQGVATTPPRRWRRRRTSTSSASSPPRASWRCSQPGSSRTSMGEVRRHEQGRHRRRCGGDRVPGEVFGGKGVGGEGASSTSAAARVVGVVAGEAGHEAGDNLVMIV